MKMRSFIFCVVGLLGSVVIAPIVCPAQESDPFSFPLPRSLDVGDRWTYSIVKIHWKDEQDTTTNTFGIFDTLSTETLTLRVVERLPIEDQTYFALSDGSLYRVDEDSRTWRYDTEAKSETIIWDIWGPLKYKIIESPVRTRRYSWIEKPVVNGYVQDCEYVDVCLSRYGPFVLAPITEPEYEGLYTWIQTVEVDTIRYDRYLGNLFNYPYTFSHADLLKLSDWGITELYFFQDTSLTTDVELNRTFVVAPNVGVVYHAFAEFFYSLYGEDWMNGSTYSDSTGAGKVGHVADPPMGELDYVEKTTWILQDAQKGQPGSTTIENTSWGQLKQRMRRPALHAP